MIEKIGVIVPSFNRHGYLERQLNWFRSLGLRDVIVADGSDTPMPGSERWGAWYRHCPGMSLTDRLKFGVSEINSPVVTFCADDDYLAKKGLEQAAGFILNESGYASAQGRYLSIENRWGKLRYGQLYNFEDGYHVQGSTPRQRMVVWMGKYMHSIYALRRLDRMRSIVNALPVEESNGNLIELAFVFGDAWFGNHMLFPDSLYMVRESLLSSGSGTTKNAVLFCSSHPIEYEDWVTQFSDSFASQVGEKKEVLLELWRDGFAAYSRNQTLRQRKAFYNFKVTVPLKIRRYMRRLAPIREPDAELVKQDDFQKIHAHALRYLSHGLT